MKKRTSFKLIAVMLSFILLFSMQVSAVANGLNPNESDCGHDHESIVFTDKNVDLQQYGVNLTTVFDEPIVTDSTQDAAISSRGLTCTLFGHNMQYSHSTLVIAHNVYSSAPRCAADLFDTYKCSRCDKTDVYWVGTGYANCH